MLDDLDDLHDIEIDDIDENLYAILLARFSYSIFWTVANANIYHFASNFSRSDEESFSETKIRLEDDEGYADDGQGTAFFYDIIRK